MSIVYIIGKIITLPGAYVKTFWEHLMCRILGVPVETTKYLHYDEALGHIEHELIASKPKSFLFCWLAGAVNEIFGMVMLTAGGLGIFYLGVEPLIRESGEKTWIFYIYLVLLYIGFSLYGNQFPLIEDALNLWEQLYGKNGVKLIWKILLFIPAVNILIGAYMERYAVNILLMLGLGAAAFFA